MGGVCIVFKVIVLLSTYCWKVYTLMFQAISLSFTVGNSTYH